jgi:hypothetical protein
MGNPTKIDPTIIHVSPVWGDPVRATGYRFECPDCSYVSPVMTHAIGAKLHKERHECKS